MSVRKAKPKPKPLPKILTPRAKLIDRSWRNTLWALVVIAVSLAIGMAGYMYFGENVTIAGSFADASMILSGQGPLDQMKTTAGHVFEGLYALVSGFLLFAIAGFALAPAFHHVMRSFHLEDQKDADSN